jgi:hypothetical protein
LLINKPSDPTIRDGFCTSITDTIGEQIRCDPSTDLWVEVIQRLLDARAIPHGSFNEVAWAAQHCPALLALWTMGLSATSASVSRSSSTC